MSSLNGNNEITSTSQLQDDITNYVNVKLDRSIFEQLKALIIELSGKGEIRATDDEKYSVLDVIRNAAAKKSAREVWSRLVRNNSEVVTRCDNFQFPGRGQRKTPVTGLDGCIYIINQLPGEMGEKMRCLTAKLAEYAIKQETSEPDPGKLATAEIASPAIVQAFTQVVTLIQAQAQQNQQVLTQSQQSMAAMMQMQQENLQMQRETNRQVQIITSTLAQLVVQKVSPSPQSPPQPQPAQSAQPQKKDSGEDSLSNPLHRQLIDDVIDEQVACNYSKMWVKHTLCHHSQAANLTKNDWLYCAKKLGYKPGWAYYRFNETCHGAKPSTR